MARKHDELFKHTFGDPRRAADALRGILPTALAAAIDWESLELLPGSFVDAQLDSRHTDLLYRAQLHGEPALLHLIFEHQGRADPLMPLRTIEYVAQGWRALLKDAPGLKRLPPILPVVLYNGARPWTAPRSLAGMYALDADRLALLRPWLPDAGFILLDLSQTEDGWLEAQFSAAVAVTLGSLKHCWTPTDLLAWFERTAALMRELLTAQRGTQVLETLFRYAFTADVTPERLAPLVAKRLGRDAEEVMMTVADRLIEQGIERGIERGIEQGRAQARAESAREFFEQLLALRFGALDEATLDQARALDLERVDALRGRLLDPSFEAVDVDRFLADPRGD